jgi:hypothetical protein
VRLRDAELLSQIDAGRNRDGPAHISEDFVQRFDFCGTLGCSDRRDWVSTPRHRDLPECASFNFLEQFEALGLELRYVNPQLISCHDKFSI